MNKEQIAKLKELAQAMPSAPFGYSFGTGYVARKTENSYFHVAQAPSGMSSTMEWERSASFIAALLEAAPELIALAERTTAPVTIPDTSQDWANLDGAVAWHLIERHADSWSEVGNMMESWLAARMAAAPAPIQRGHDSDCTVHNAPSLPVGPCNCSLRAWEWAPNVKLADDEIMFFSSIYQTSEGLPVMTDCDEHGAWNVAIILKRRADGVDYRHPVRIIPVDEAATPPALAGSQVQAAGDEVNEREAFEAWQREKQGWLYTAEAEEGTFQEERWIAWQARAAMRAKP